MPQEMPRLAIVVLPVAHFGDEGDLEGLAGLIDEALRTVLSRLIGVKKPASAAERPDRRLTAILAADVAGYSRLIEADEEGTLAHLKALRSTLMDPKIAQHRGRIVKTTGDGMLVAFASVVDALRCAVAVQRGIAARNADAPREKRIEFRMGVHQGDIVVDSHDIFGDGVNVAARLQGAAEPGGICVSSRVQEDTRGKLDVTFEDGGEQHFKNIERAVRVYRVGLSCCGREPPAYRTRIGQRPGITPILTRVSADPRVMMAEIPLANFSRTAGRQQVSHSTRTTSSTSMV